MSCYSESISWHSEYIQYFLILHLNLTILRLYREILNIYFEIQNLNLAILRLFLAIPVLKIKGYCDFLSSKGENELGDKMSQLSSLYFVEKKYDLLIFIY